MGDNRKRLAAKIARRFFNPENEPGRWPSAGRPALFSELHPIGDAGFDRLFADLDDTAAGGAEVFFLYFFIQFDDGRRLNVTRQFHAGWWDFNRLSIYYDFHQIILINGTIIMNIKLNGPDRTTGEGI